MVPKSMDWSRLVLTGDRLFAARNGRHPLVEFMRDPSLSVACVLLIVVSLGWVIVTRLIVHRMKRAARKGIRNPATDAVRPARDVWSMPP